jgi:pyruvate,water dikinase
MLNSPVGMTTSEHAPYVIWLDDCTDDCERVVGRKAVGLGALLRQGFQVPNGFAVTTRAYCEHIERNHLSAAIERLLQDSATYDTQLRVADEIRELFEASRPSPELEDALLKAHAQLIAAAENRPVAVRSSATDEDQTAASFAGQQETYLWLLSGESVLQHVVRCWGSLFTAHALAYRAHLNIPVVDLAMGVVVQRMVPAEAGGVMLTLDPITGDRSGIVIEAAYGLGMAVVNGEVEPDRAVVDKQPLQIRSRTIGCKTKAYRFDASQQGTQLVEVDLRLQSQPSVTDEELVKLAGLGKQMESVMGRPQDMEWAIGPGDHDTREVFLLQARPETIWSNR